MNDNEQCPVACPAPQVKTCTKCGATKPVTEFYSAPNGKYGVRADCKECNKAKAARYLIDNPNYQKEYSAKNSDKLRAKGAAYRAENPEKTRAAQKRWRKEHPGSYKERYAKNRAKFRVRAAEKKAANPEPFRRYAREWSRRYRATARGRLETNIRSGVYKGIITGAKAGRKTFNLLGYTPEKLMRHLEKQFESGMTWENYGRNGWHVDHIIPLSVHNYQTPDDPDFKRAWALKNLQPMWEPENISKGAKLEREFQPSLAMPMPTNDNIKRSDKDIA